MENQKRNTTQLLIRSSTGVKYTLYHINKNGDSKVSMIMILALSLQQQHNRDRYRKLIFKAKYIMMTVLKGILNSKTSSYYNFNTPKE